MIKPTLPKSGEPTIPALKKAVQDIINYLPSLEIRGDNLTTFVNESPYGKIIRAKGQNTGGVAQSSGGNNDLLSGEPGILAYNMYGELIKCPIPDKYISGELSGKAEYLIPVFYTGRKLSNQNKIKMPIEWFTIKTCDAPQVPVETLPENPPTENTENEVK